MSTSRMLEKDRKKPGLYETQANLGTFHLHDGQLEHIEPLAAARRR